VEKVSGVVAGIAFLGSGVCGLIAMAVFTAKSTSDSSTYSHDWLWGFILGWIGTVLAGIIGLLAIGISFCGKHHAPSKRNQSAASIQVDSQAGPDPSPAPQRSSSKAVAVVPIILGVIIFVLLAASCGGRQWLDWWADNGLWVTSDCGASWFCAVRAFSLLAIFATVAGILASLLFLLGKVPGFLAGVAYIGAGICGLITMSIYTGKVDSYNSYGWGWSFILGWVGTCLAGLSGLLTIGISMIGRRNASQNPS